MFFILLQVTLLTALAGFIYALNRVRQWLSSGLPENVIDRRFCEIGGDEMQALEAKKLCTGKPLKRPEGESQDGMGEPRHRHSSGGLMNSR